MAWSASPPVGETAGRTDMPHVVRRSAEFKRADLGDNCRHLRGGMIESNSPKGGHDEMSSIRDFLLAWSKLGRGFYGSAAYPDPPRLPVPDEIREAVDAQDSNGEVSPES